MTNMGKKTMKLALEGAANYIDALGGDSRKYRQALAEQPAQQEPVSCPVCNQVHTILDADESQIIRNAKDGYPDGRTPRLLTLQERVAALCQYASDWKRWCLEKENTTPQAQPAQQEPVGEIGKIVMFGGDLKEVSWKNGKMPPAGSILYTRPQAREPEQPAQQQQEPYEIEWPEYHEHAMGCGLEDRDERCRYGAMRYGWDCAIEAVAQAMPDVIYTSPPAQRKPLTDEQIDNTTRKQVDDLLDHIYEYGTAAEGIDFRVRAIARAIEAAHGIKENT